MNKQTAFMEAIRILAAPYRIVRFFLFLPFVLLASQTFMYAQTSTWTGTSSSDWNTAGNWSPAGVPNSATADVIIPNGLTRYPSLSANIEVRSITLNGSGTGNPATLTFNSFNLTAREAVIVNAWSGSTSPRRIGTNAAHTGKLIIQPLAANIGSTTVTSRFVPDGTGTSKPEINAPCEFYIQRLGSVDANNTRYQGAIFNNTVSMTISTDRWGNFLSGSNTYNENVSFNFIGTDFAAIGYTASWFVGGQEAFAKNLTISTTGNSVDLWANVVGNLSVTTSGTGQLQFGSAISSCTVTGTSTFTLNGNTGGDGIRIAQNASEVVTLSGNVNITNTNSTINELFRCARLGSVTFNGNITASSTGGASGSRRIRIGDDEAQAGTIAFAANRIITATGVQVGELHINKITQASGLNTHTHDLSVAAAVSLQVNRNTLHGNLTATGNLMQFRRNVIGSSAANVHSLSHIGTTTGSSNGGNIFHGNTTLNSVAHTANIDWNWGWNDGGNNGGADVFNGDLTITTGNERTTTLANNTTGNQVNGSLTMTTANGTSQIANSTNAALTVTGTTTFTVTGVRTTDTWRQGVTIADGIGSSVNLQGNVSIVQNGAGPVRFYNIGTVAFGGDIEVSSTGGGSVEFGPGTGTGTATLAAGKSITTPVSFAGMATCPTDWWASNYFRIGRLTQTGSSGAHNITTSGCARLVVQSSTLGGTFTANTPAFRFYKNTFNGAVNITQSSPSYGEDGMNGGNNFNGNFALTILGSNGFQWAKNNPTARWGSDTPNQGGNDSYTGTATFNLNGTADLVLGEYATATFGGAVTVNLNSTGRLRMGGWGNDHATTLTFNDAFTLNNAGTNTSDWGPVTIARFANSSVNFKSACTINSTVSGVTVNIVQDGTVNYEGNLTLNLAGTSATSFSGGTGWNIFTGGNAQQFASNESTTTNIRRLRVNKSANALSLQNTLRTSTELHLQSGNLVLNNNELFLHTSATTPVNATLTGGSASSYLVATGTGRVYRQVEPSPDIVFPVGTTTAYMPITVDLNGTDDQFGVRLATLGNAPYSISSHFVSMGWDVWRATTKAGNANYTLQWPAGTELASFDRTKSAVYRWNGSQFNCIQAEAAASGSGPYTRIISNLNSTEGTGIFALATAVANAGADVTTSSCGAITLSANASPFTGPGLWSRVSGPSGVTFANAASPTTLVSGLVTGTYVLRWTTASGCTDRSDDVTVNFTLVPSVPQANTTWTGNANNGVWSDCANWSNSNPGEVSPGVFSSVTIPGGLTTMYPVLSANATVNSLTMTAGASINLANFTLEARGATALAGSTVTANGGVLLKNSTTNDTWAGGNTFSGNLTIRHSGAGGTLTLAGTSGNTFASTSTVSIADHTYTFDIAHASADIILGTNSVTSTLVGNAAFVSLRNADFQAGNLSFTTNIHSTIRSTGLQPGRRAAMNNYTINRGATVTFYGLHTVTGTMTLTQGRTLLADGSNLLLDNSSPAAIAGVGNPLQDGLEITTGDVMLQSGLAGTGTFSWRCAPNASPYRFPTGFGDWNSNNVRWGRMSAFTFTLQSGTDIITVRSIGYTLPAADYDDATNARSGSISNEFVNLQWQVTCANPASVLEFKDVNLPWRHYSVNDLFEQSTFTPARNRSGIMRYHHTTDNWECIMQLGAPSSIGTDRYAHTATGVLAKTSATNLGVFGIASATADVVPTATAQNTACRTITLDADDNMVATSSTTVVHPVGGQWVFVSGPSTPSIADPTNPFTTAVGASADGNYVFEWRRFSTACGGSLATPIHSAQVTIAVSQAAVSIPSATTWTGLWNTDWSHCANWSNGVPGTSTTVTLPASAPRWPKLSGHTSIYRLITTTGSELDLDIYTLTTSNLVPALPASQDWWNYHTILTGATIRSANNASIQAKLQTRYMEVRKTTFTGKIEVAVSETSAANAFAFMSNGGNIFQEDAKLSLVGRSQSLWGWNNSANNGGPDLFMKNLDVVVEDALTVSGPGTRPTNYNTTYSNTFPTNYATNYPVPVDYLSEPYYVYGAAPGTYTGAKAGFGSYPRPTNLVVNSVDPAVNAANANTNASNNAANLLDEEQSRQNIQTALTNLTTARDNASGTITNLNNALSTGNSVLTQVSVLPAYTNNEGGVVSAYNALQTAVANGNARVSPLTASRDNASAGITNTANAPGNDHALANAAHAESNAANVQVIAIYNAINALFTAVNNANTAYNAANKTANDTGNDTGFIRIADNTAGNEVRGNLTVRTGPATPNALPTAPGGRVFLANNTSTLLVNGNMSLLNHGRGGWEAILVANNNGASFTVNGSADILNKGTGAIWAGKAGSALYKNNILVSSTAAGDVYFGNDVAGASVVAEAGLGIHPDGLSAGRLYFRYFTHLPTNRPVSFAVNGSALLHIQNQSTWNSQVAILNASSGDEWGGAVYIGHSTSHTVTFNQAVTLRNLANSTSDLYMGRNGTVNFNGGDLTIENLNTIAPGVPGSCLAQLGPEGWVTTNVGQINFATGHTLKLGAAGFANGELELQRIFHGASPFEMVLPTADFPIAGVGNSAATTQLRIRRSDFAGTATIGGPSISFQTSTYRDNLNVICYNTGLSSGGNTVDGTTVIEFRGTGDWRLANGLPDIFNDNVKYWNNGNNSRIILGEGAIGSFFNKLIIENGGTTTGSHLCRFQLGGNGAQMTFNDEVSFINKAQQDITIAPSTADVLTFQQDVLLENVGSSGTFGSIRFGTGKTILAAAADFVLVNFPNGDLELRNVEMLGDLSQTHTFDMRAQNGGNGLARVRFGSGSVWRRNIVARGPHIGLEGADFHGIAQFTRTNGRPTTGQWMPAKNTFRGDFNLTVEATEAPSGDGQWYALSNHGNVAGDFVGDTFLGNAIFTTTPAAWASGYRIRVSNNYVSHFAKNITFQTNAPTSTSTTLCGSSASGIRFIGSGEQWLYSDLLQVSVPIVEVMQTSATDRVRFDKEMRVTSRIQFNKGKIQLQSLNLQVDNESNAGSVVIMDPSSGYVITAGEGAIIRKVPGGASATNVIFPVGSSLTYQPVTVKNNNTADENFSVRLINGAYLGYNASTLAPAGTNISGHFVGSSWLVRPVVSNPNSNAEVTIQWDISNELTYFDRSSVSLVRFNTASNKWSCLGLPGVAVSAPPVARKTETSVTGFGVFSAASIVSNAGPDAQACYTTGVTLNAQPLLAPFSGYWSFVDWADDPDGTAMPTNPSNPGVAFSNVANPNTGVSGIAANKVYRFRWTNNGLDNSCGSLVDEMILRVGNVTTSPSGNLLVWQGVSSDLFDCQNWKVHINETTPVSPQEFAIPNGLLDVTIPGGGLPYYPELNGIALPVRNLTVLNGGAFTVGTGGSLVVGQALQLEAGATFTNNQSVNIAGDLVISGTYHNTSSTTANAVTNLLGELRTNNGAVLLNTGTLKLAGDWENNGPLVMSDGLIEWTGGNAIFSGTHGATLSRLQVNKDMGASIVLAQPLTVGNSLTLDQGKIQSSASALLTLTETATSTQGNPNSFVNGPLRKIGNADFTFPIGKGNVWARLGISAFTGSLNPATDHFTAEYFFNPYSDYSVNDDLTIYGKLNNASGIEHWDLSRTSGTAAVKVTLFWENGGRSVISDLNDLRVAHYDHHPLDPAQPKKWQNMGRGNTSGTTATGSITSDKHFTSFSPITLGSESKSVNFLPVALLGFEGKYMDGKGNQLVWKTASEINNAGFILKRSIGNDRQFEEIAHYESVAALRGKGTTNDPQAYTFWDNQDLAPGETHYYQLQQLDLDGKTTTHKVVAVNVGAKVVLYQNHPNPTNGKTSFRFAIEREGLVKLELFDVQGRPIDVITNAVHEAGMHIYPYDVSQLQSGVYILRMHYGDKIMTIKASVVK